MKEFQRLGLSLLAAAAFSAVPANAQLLKGTVTAKEMPDMLVHYSPDGDVLNTVDLEVKPDEKGSFTFDAKLPKQAIDAAVYVNNDIFGVRLERGKQAVINIKADEKGESYTAEISGDNAKESNFYNTYVRAYDVMKYFAPDPSEAKSYKEYRQILEDENAKVAKALPTVKDKKLRDYYTRLSEGMYKWTKIRIIMDLAYDEKKKCSDYPEYNELIATIDPNDTINIPTNLSFAWLSAKAPAEYEGDQAAGYIRQLQVVDGQITNPTVKAVLMKSIPNSYFAYSKPTAEGAARFMEQFCVYAKDYPALVAACEEKAKSIVEVKEGAEVPYDPEMTRPDGTKCRFADFKGKVLYIDVWATWCGPCCKEIPHLEKVVEQMKDNDKVRFISVSVDENHDAWQKKLDKDKPQWEQFILSPEEGRQFMEKWGVNGIPRFIILSSDGLLVNADAPRPSNTELIDTLNKVK